MGENKAKRETGPCNVSVNPCGREPPEWREERSTLNRKRISKRKQKSGIKGKKNGWYS